MFDAPERTLTLRSLSNAADQRRFASAARYLADNARMAETWKGILK